MLRQYMIRDIVWRVLLDADRSVFPVVKYRILQ
jgi:hypothetical protein